MGVIDAVIAERLTDKGLKCGEMSSLYLQKDEGVEAGKSVGFDALNFLELIGRSYQEDPQLGATADLPFFFDTQKSQ